MQWVYGIEIQLSSPGQCEFLCIWTIVYFSNATPKFLMSCLDSITCTACASLTVVVEIEHTITCSTLQERKDCKVVCWCWEWRYTVTKISRTDFPPKARIVGCYHDYPFDFFGQKFPTEFETGNTASISFSPIQWPQLLRRSPLLIAFCQKFSVKTNKVFLHCHLNM